MTATKYQKGVPLTEINYSDPIALAEKFSRAEIKEILDQISVPMKGPHEISRRENSRPIDDPIENGSLACSQQEKSNSGQ